MTRAQKELDINLWHNILQEVLNCRLKDEYGTENVGTELQSCVGTSVGVMVRLNNEFWFYEIKTARSPCICLRQALGQLLCVRYNLAKSDRIE